MSFNRKHRSDRPQNVRPQSLNRKSASAVTLSSWGRVTLMLLSSPVTTEGDMSLVSLFSLAQKMFKSILLTTRCPICTSSQLFSDAFTWFDSRRSTLLFRSTLFSDPLPISRHDEHWTVASRTTRVLARHENIAPTMETAERRSGRRSDSWLRFVTMFPAQRPSNLYLHVFSL